MGELYNPFPKLPKNFRQIGDPDPVVRLYVEDYVNTYLKRLYPSGSQGLRVGLLLGSVEQNDGTPYIFIDGALEMEDIETDGDKVAFAEGAWKKAYREIEKAFTRRNIQGWFLCGSQGSQLSPLNYWKQHVKYFTGKNQLMYLNHGLEGDESIYITSENGFYKLKGHCIYYERNQLMQDYMVTRRDARRIESGVNEKVIRDFRDRMSEKKEMADRQRHTAGVLGLACGVLTAAVLAGGVVMVNNYNKMQRMESVLTSVLPAGTGSWEDFVRQKAEEPDFVIEELPGGLYPLADGMEETGESYGTGEGARKEQAGTQGAGEDAQREQAGTPGPEGSARQEQAGTQGTGAGVQQNGEQEPAGSARREQAGTQGTGAGVQQNGEQEPTASVQQDQAQSTAPEAGEALSYNAELSADASVTDPDDVEEAVPYGEGDRGEPELLPPIDYEAAAAEGKQIYEVSEGETLYGICWDVYGSLDRLGEICRLNRLENEDMIIAGQKLILP